ncbi:hypothetical protein SERLADRAFT_409095 [Serpula lacrymans var. lacrymans S7.9]|uniref:Uncharacterized protein n=1 Tax=Serpula lacrymans var. lacrymans (strain S7.9) TaxID=578457 RepID=F8NZ24_SERL9|nr:uncharacterized protein SERLADRAFT_409095 [Serpula lacrymans var. lacrymans S7.9]EGO23844.1 hypothetical protein SERLADRAFT_409095 [Serpula lacrymans var. lacrymans S7.9]
MYCLLLVPLVPWVLLVVIFSINLSGLGTVLAVHNLLSGSTNEQRGGYYFSEISQALGNSVNNEDMAASIQAENLLWGSNGSDLQLNHMLASWHCVSIGSIKLFKIYYIQFQLQILKDALLHACAINMLDIFDPLNEDIADDYISEANAQWMAEHPYSQGLVHYTPVSDSSDQSDLHMFNIVKKKLQSLGKGKREKGKGKGKREKGKREKGKGKGKRKEKKKAVDNYCSHITPPSYNLFWSGEGYNFANILNRVGHVVVPLQHPAFKEAVVMLAEWGSSRCILLAVYTYILTILYHAFECRSSGIRRGNALFSEVHYQHRVFLRALRYVQFVAELYPEFNACRTSLWMQNIDQHNFGPLGALNNADPF